MTSSDNNGGPHSRSPGSGSRPRRRLYWRIAIAVVSVVLIVLFARAYLLIAATHVQLIPFILDDWSVLVPLLIMGSIGTPLGAFGSIVAVIFAIGWF